MQVFDMMVTYEDIDAINLFKTKKKAGLWNAEVREDWFKIWQKIEIVWITDM